MIKSFKVIKDFPNYRVSNTGKVISYARYPEGKELKYKVDRDGYYVVILYTGDGKPHYRGVHVLCANIFVSGYHEGFMVNHKDNNTLNNLYTNLEWVTNQGNQLHSINTRNNSNQKVVQQIGSSGEVIAEFDSVRQVTRVLGFDNSTISKVCREERKSAYGYYWRYV